MRELVFDEGGRPLANDDLDVLQTDLNYATTATLQGLEPHVVANVALTQRGTTYDVGYGIVWLGGQLLKFNGASGITLPAEIVLGDVVVYDERAYQTGGTKPCIREQTTTIRAATTEAVPKIRVTADGVLRYHKVLEKQFRQVGDLKACAAANASEYDNVGRGKYGTASYGWAICGVPGTLDTQGRFLVGQNREVQDYQTIGQTGGAATVTLDTSQIPPHTHSTQVYKSVTEQGDDGKRRTTIDPGYRDTFTSSSTGGGQPHENRPPYVVVTYRQWIGF